MHQIKAKPLTPEAFRKYGTYQDLLDDASLAQNSVFPFAFYPDLITLNFANTTLPSVCVCRVEKTEKNIIAFAEAHKYTCEGLLPIDGDVVIFVGTPGFGGRINPKSLEAFYVPKGTFVKLNPLIVHGSQYAVNDGVVHVLCMLPERTFANDMEAFPLGDEDKVEIVL
jgi:ureidoglycolate lyase